MGFYNWDIVSTARHGLNLRVMYINPSKLSGHYMQHQLNIQQFYVLHSVFMCFVWIWEQTAIISLNSIEWLVFITEECLLRGTGWVFYIYVTYINSRLQSTADCITNGMSSVTSCKTHIHLSEIPLAQSMKANNRTAQPAYTTVWHYTVNRPRSWAALSDLDGPVSCEGHRCGAGRWEIHIGPQITFTSHLTCVTFKLTLWRHQTVQHR